MSFLIILCSRVRHISRVAEHGTAWRQRAADINFGSYAQPVRSRVRWRWQGVDTGADDVSIWQGRDDGVDREGREGTGSPIGFERDCLGFRTIRRYIVIPDACSVRAPLFSNSPSLCFSLSHSFIHSVWFNRCLSLCLNRCVDVWNMSFFILSRSLEPFTSCIWAWLI